MRSLLGFHQNRCLNPSWCRQEQDQSAGASPEFERCCQIVVIAETVAVADRSLKRRSKPDDPGDGGVSPESEFPDGQIHQVQDRNSHRLRNSLTGRRQQAFDKPQPPARIRQQPTASREPIAVRDQKSIRMSGSFDVPYLQLASIREWSRNRGAYTAHGQMRRSASRR